MKAKEITYRRTFHLGHMSCETIELRLELGDGEEASEAFALAKKFVLSRTEAPKDGSSHNSVASPSVRKPLVSRASLPGQSLDSEVL